VIADNGTSRGVPYHVAYLQDKGIGVSQAGKTVPVVREWRLPSVEEAAIPGEVLLFDF
jgi:hypothetical protein